MKEIERENVETDLNVFVKSYFNFFRFRFFILNFFFFILYDYFIPFGFWYKKIVKFNISSKF